MALIAIVDDSKLARVFNAAALKKLGHELLEIEPVSLFDVLGILKQKKPDLMLVDYLMPNCPGASLVRACHEDPALSQIKVIMLTAHREEEIQGRLTNLGVQHVLHKPVDPKVLEEAVTHLLEG
jgi:CheY-like chemotaxis protein